MRLQLFKAGSLRRRIACATLFTLAAYPENWPAWRGPASNGISAEKNLPIHWSKTENVRWRIPLPERGNSTPIVWGDRIFLTQPIEKEGRRTLMCLDRASGKLLWQSGATYTEPETTHPTNPHASPSPVTDGERVIVWFGSAGVFAYGIDGRELWRRDLGKQKHIWGHGSSPVLHGDLVFLNFGPGERSFLIALNKKTGETVWRKDLQARRTEPAPPGMPGAGKDEYYGSWSTPLVIRVDGHDELVLDAAQRVYGLDPKTGRELWRCEGLSDLVYPMPVFGDGVVVAMGSFQGSSLAVRAGGSGDVTPTRRLWHVPRSKLRLGSAVIAGGYIYTVDIPGIAECIELETGKSVWTQRLTANGGSDVTWSSLVLSEGKLYMMNQSGDTFVFAASPKFQLLAANVLDEPSNSSVVPSGENLLLRTHEALWCIGKK